MTARMLRLVPILVLLRTQMPAFGSPLRVDALQCEHISNPLGIDARTPRLSWALHSRRRGEIQTSYRIIVASSRGGLDSSQGDLWDSGKVASDRSVLVTYAGKSLASRQTCWWKVQVWDGDDRPSGWSAPARWEMGLLDPGDWQAKWIGLEGGDQPERILPARMLRREFAVRSRVRRARAYVCGLGLYELYLNGRKVEDHVLDPALSQYEKRVFYVAYDVTRCLIPGANAVGVILGNGRYYAPRLSVPIPTQAFGYPKALLQMEIEYADGSRENVVTDERWLVTAEGPIRANNEYDGEVYDARKDLPGWCLPDYAGAGWQPAQVVKGPGGLLSSQMSPPIRVVQTLRPVSLRQSRSGAWLFDMGQNMVGWCRLRVSGPSGAVITLRHAETLNADGTLYIANLRSARATDVYTLAGTGAETWEPRFTYHGFRYVEVTGFPGTPTLGSIEGRVVHDDLADGGSFTCDSDLVNRIWRNIRWGMRGNYRSIPTDCPQRDERQGWLGDRSAESRGECYLFDVSAFYSRWLDDIRDSQRADGSIPDVAPTYWPLYNDDVTWPSTYIIIPGVLYDQYGDDGPIVANYPAMKRWAEHMKRYLVDDLMPRDTYGDWCVPPESPELIHSKDPARRTDGTLIATAYFCYDLKLLTRYAPLAGRPQDAREFEDLADRIAAAFNRRFFKGELNVYGNGSQTSSVLPLAFGLVPAGREQAVLAELAAKIERDGGPKIGAGLLGCQWLMRVLSNRGRADLAWQLATREEYPSWGYMVKQGATTVWELWNGDTADPAMNSQNHVMLVGDLLTWLYEDVAGIAPDNDQPGFKRIVMHPRNVVEIGHARATHRSPYGLIVSDWRARNGMFIWDVEVPANTRATLWFPATSTADVSEGGGPAAAASGVGFIRSEAGSAVYEAGSGRYHFRLKLSPK